ncbi:uncharacterized protein LOC143226288 isoform X2 [Tachypleus tridentatus]
MPHFANETEMLLVVTEDDLKIFCQNFKNSTTCIKKYTERCFDPAQRDAYKDMTQGAQELMDEICDEKSDLRQKYLEHTTCYKKLPKDRREMCLDVYMRDNKFKNADVDYETKLRWYCCFQAHHISCLKSVIKDFCNDDAADFAVSIIKQATKSVYKKCQEYSTDSLNCLSSGNIQRTSALLLILYFVFLIW